MNINLKSLLLATVEEQQSGKRYYYHQTSSFYSAISPNAFKFSTKFNNRQWVIKYDGNHSRTFLNLYTGEVTFKDPSETTPQSMISNRFHGDLNGNPRATLCGMTSKNTTRMNEFNTVVMRDEFETKIIRLATLIDFNIIRVKVFFVVNADNLFGQAMTILARMRPMDFKKILMVRFHGQQGIDYGALMR